MSAITGEILKGHVEAREKLTAKLFWKLTSDTGYNNAGDIREYADASTRSLVTRVRADDGARHVTDEQVDLNHEAYTFLLDERITEQERLIKLARRLANQSQAASEGATATISDVNKGRWYAIGAYNVANVRVTGSLSGVLDEGTDYSLDKPNGRIYVEDDGGVAEDEDLTLTFDEPGMDFEKYETQFNPLFYVDVIIEEHNQFDKMWLRRGTGTGYLSVIEFPSFGSEFATYRVKFTPSAAMTWLKRQEAATLPTHAETAGEAAAASSSSSSTSSSSSAISTSASSSSS